MWLISNKKFNRIINTIKVLILRLIKGQILAKILPGILISNKKILIIINI